MQKYSDKEKRVKHFAQNQLGCNCPEEVFSSILTGRKIIKELPDLLIQEILIGNRLLIYIAPVHGKNHEIETILEHLVAEGKKERDSNNYNRFRLVFHSDQQNIDVDNAFLYFNRMKHIDERIHLHIFAESEIPGPLFPNCHNLSSKDI